MGERKKLYIDSGLLAAIVGRAPADFELYEKFGDRSFLIESFSADSSSLRDYRP